MRPQALVFGWFGAKTSTLRRYSALYSKLLQTDRVLTLPTTILRATTWTGWKLDRSAAQQYPPGYFEDVRVVHLCSGGVFPFHNVRTVREDLQPHSVVYDSGPFLPRASHVAHYATKALSVPFSIESAVAKFWTTEGFTMDDAPVVEHLRAQPLLLLNSEADDIVPRCGLQPVLAPKGAPVTMKTWPDSLHAQHYRTYTTEYEDAVRTFLGRAGLDNSTKQP